jgi:DNA-binding transcriptional regulator YiaG
MNGFELKNIRTKLGLNQTQMGQELGVNNETICRWERKNTELGKLQSDAVRRLLEQKGAAHEDTSQL